MTTQCSCINKSEIAPTIKIKETIGFIGGGNMAKAICEGMVRKGKVNKILAIKAVNK